jgi:predicted TIM-barrel fold metal-dependent hydrolase
VNIEEDPMSRTLMVSSDCHVMARIEDYRPYVESKHRDDFNRWAAQLPSYYGNLPSFFHEESLAKHNDHDSVRAGGEDGYWDFDRRILELEADGVSAEVIFPNPGVPFGAFPMTGSEPNRGQIHAGMRIYNRWLADRVSLHPGRHAGVALIAIDDISQSIAEVEWAREAGLRGVLLPIGMGAHPLYNDERYEALWAACAALEMPVHTHAFPSCNPVAGPGGSSITTHESLFHTQRPLWCMMLGGAFHRHPGLRFVVTEAGIEWIPGLLAALDTAWTGHPTQEFTKHVRLTPQAEGLTPGEIWRRQCWAGASFMPRAETEMRHAIGIDRVMWGSDYPHVEGTWPHTQKFLKDAFEGVPEEEVQKLVGENAVECYGFDRALLAPVAERIGGFVG